MKGTPAMSFQDNQKNGSPVVAATNEPVGKSFQSSVSANFREIASDLIARGLSVIPVVPHDKKPLVGAKSRSNNPEVISRWTDVWPDANVGVCSDENFTILETDDEATLRDKVRAMTGSDIPETLTLSSGRPNRCAFIFKRTPACGGKCLELPGIFEGRNVNQYVVGPGSIHPNGSVYRWRLDVPIAEMPNSLMAALVEMDRGYKGAVVSEHVAPGGVVKLRDRYLYEGNPEDMFGVSGVRFAENERHYALMSIAGLLHDGERSAEEIADVLMRVRDGYCDDAVSKSDSEVQRIAEWAAKHEPFVFEPINLPTYAVGTIAFGSAEERDKWVADNPPWRDLFHSYDETLNAPDISFAISGFLQEGGITMLGGLPGHGKTLAALAMAKAILQGPGARLFSNFHVMRETKRVVYLIPESGLAPFVSRLRTFGLIKYVGKTLFYRTFAKDGNDLLLTDERLIQACKGADVFLDTAVRFMEGDENAVQDQRVFARACFDLLREGAATLTALHHSPKSSGKENYMTLENILRGSGDLGAMAAACWGFRQVNKATNSIYVENVKARDFSACEPFILEGRPHLDATGEFKLTHKPGTAGKLNSHVASPGGRPAGKGKLEALPLIAGWVDEGLSFRAIGKRLGVDKNTVQKWLQEGAGSGEGGGQ
jgi:hypothetical protein